ncbi:MAG TPA: phage tail protein [Candidatus Binataceae bacterium]|nr:phage tail protein [Candidatus Binataceae bacterium]
MFAALGDIVFEVVGSPESIQSTTRFDYAEQRVVEDKPRLQWLANDLERIRLEIFLHASFTDPGAQIVAIRAAGSAHLALPLVLGNGGFRGFYVIEAVAVRSRQSSAGGAPIAITASIELKEWSLESELDSAAPPIPGFAPLGLSAASGGTAGPVTAAAPIPGVSAVSSLPANIQPPATTVQGFNLDAVPASSIVRGAAQ